MRVSIRHLACLGLLFAVGASLYGQEFEDALELYRSGNYQRAVEVTLRELELTPRNMDSYAVLGWSLLALNRSEEALEYGLQGLEISQFDPRVIQIVGDAHYRLGNNLEAVEYLQQYIAINPSGSVADYVYYLLGETFIRLGEYNNADIAISAACFITPRYPEWWTRLGFAREQAGDLEYALEAYNEALERNPNFAQALQGQNRVQNLIDTGG
jgi:tetratricopeptide (TPR) repeat protein